MQWVAFGIFLLVSAGEDLRKKTVDIRVYLVSGCVAVGIVGWEIVSLPSAGWRILTDSLTGAALGVGLLGAGRLCSGRMGVGDGLFFCISGLYLGFWNNLLLLWLGSLCCGLFCLGYYVWGKLFGHRNLGQAAVPFLPFVAVPGIWMTTEAIGRMLETGVF